MEPRTTAMSVQEVAELLRVSRQTVYRRIQDGSLAMGDGGKVTSESLAAFIQGRTVTQKSELPSHPSLRLPRLYTLAEVAQATGLSRRSLEDGARAGKFEHVRQCGKRWMTEEHINKLLVRSTVAAQDPEDGLSEVRARLLRGNIKRRRKAA